MNYFSDPCSTHAARGLHRVGLIMSEKREPSDELSSLRILFPTEDLVQPGLCSFGKPFRAQFSSGGHQNCLASRVLDFPKSLSADPSNSAMRRG
jgi:hypothetical protein